MDKNSIIQLITDYLNKPRYKIVGQKWVMTECPFAKITHDDKDDTHFSFGISIDNGYHCFTCGEKGKLENLPNRLKKLGIEVPIGIKEYIQTYKNTYDLDTDIIHSQQEKNYLTKEVYADIPLLNETILNITPEDAKKFDIRYKDNSLIFPIFDKDNNLVGVKVRFLPRGFYYLTNSKFKLYGVWYGEHLINTADKKFKDFIFLTEGERDTIFLHRFGIPAIGCLGGISVKQIDRLFEFDKKLVLCFDNDDAGRKYKEIIREKFAGIRKLYHITDYKGCKDVAEAIEKGLFKEVYKSIKIL
ncbi:MAG: toprim domain-containing protein [Candidatus Aenigmatarchaeota archaeon]